MNRSPQRKLTRQELNPNRNALLICNPRTGSLLTYSIIRALLRDRDIRDRDIGRGTSGRWKSGR
jgi:hypothetical protein